MCKVTPYSLRQRLQHFVCLKLATISYFKVFNQLVSGNVNGVPLWVIKIVVLEMQVDCGIIVGKVGVLTNEKFYLKEMICTTPDQHLSGTQI